MTDDEFMEAEEDAQSALSDFKRACDQAGFDFDDRMEDLIFNAKGDE